MNNIYKTAKQLGEHYLDLMKQQDYFSLKYPAVMFDIDDTFISSKTYKPIKPIIKLMKECNRRNLLLLIITARDSRYTKETVDELKANGIYSRHDNFYGVPRGAIFYDFLY
jgi:hydroxymethylpyrimidine pyrophosphatase-like HAD family hydrolase